MNVLATKNKTAKLVGQALSGIKNTMRDKKIIFIVDDDPTNLAVGKEILKVRYTVYPLTSADLMFALLEDVRPHLILLDIIMPDMDGYEAVKRLKSNMEYCEIPVMFLSAKTGEGDELRGLNLGAIDYVRKPFSPPLLHKRIENYLTIVAQQQQLEKKNANLHVVAQRKTEEVLKLQGTILSTVADLVEFRDEETGGHIHRTRLFMDVLMNKMLACKLYQEETEDWDIEYMSISAQLHDVGKIAISDAILQKPGKLTEEEYAIMRTHAAIGASIIRSIEDKASETTFLKHAERIAEAHHEKWDGSGYPKALKGTDIPLEGRLMAIVDVYDALVSERAYKPAFSTEKACEIIKEGRETHFDPALTDLFCEVSDDFENIVISSSCESACG